VLLVIGIFIYGFGIYHRIRIINKPVKIIYKNIVINWQKQENKKLWKMGKKEKVNE